MNPRHISPREALLSQPSATPSFDVSKMLAMLGSLYGLQNEQQKMQMEMSAEPERLALLHAQALGAGAEAQSKQFTASHAQEGWDRDMADAETRRRLLDTQIAGLQDERSLMPAKRRSAEADAATREFTSSHMQDEFDSRMAGEKIRQGIGQNELGKSSFDLAFAPQKFQMELQDHDMRRKMMDAQMDLYNREKTGEITPQDRLKYEMYTGHPFVSPEERIATEQKKVAERAALEAREGAGAATTPSAVSAFTGRSGGLIEKAPQVYDFLDRLGLGFDPIGGLGKAAFPGHANLFRGTQQDKDAIWNYVFGAPKAQLQPQR